MNTDQRTKNALAGVLLKILRQRGALAGVRLALENIDEIASAAVVSTRFRIAPSTLRRWKKAGRAIAFRPLGAKRDFFPVAQFSRKCVASWAESIVSRLGNGAPAFHFLMVRRKALGNVSYSRWILEGHSAAIEMIEEGLSLIEIE
jgi:hypothetical protein